MKEVSRISQSQGHSKLRRLWPIGHVLPSRQVSLRTALNCTPPVPAPCCADPTQLRANCLPCITGGVGVRWPVSVRGCATAAANSRRLPGTPGGRPIGRLDRAIDVCVAGFASGRLPNRNVFLRVFPASDFSGNGWDGNLSLPPLQSGAADRCTHSALGHACHDLRLSVDLPRYILALPNSSYEKQVLRLNRLDRKRGVERQTMMSSLNLRFVACSNFFSPSMCRLLPCAIIWPSIDLASQDVLARCRCLHLQMAE